MKILEIVVETKCSYDTSLYNLLYEYLLLDINDYQQYLANDSTLSFVLSTCFAKSYLTLYSQTPLEDFQLSIALKLKISLPKENDDDYMSFMNYLKFIDRVYNYHFNNEFLRKLSKEIYNVVLAPLFQNQILSSSRRGISQNAIQYLIFILENISSSKLAQCIFYFLFNFGDIFYLTQESFNIKQPSYTPTKLTNFLLSQLSETTSISTIIWQLLAQLLSFNLPTFVKLITHHDLKLNTVKTLLQHRIH